MATLKTNTLTGTSTAGSIAVTGEGNSTTTNLQQGLAKVWIDIPTDGASINDSFNVSTLTDVDTADRSVNLTSSMGSTNFSVNSTVLYAHGSSGHGVRTAPVASKTASVINIDTGKANGSGQFDFEDRPSGMSAHGDLA